MYILVGTDVSIKKEIMTSGTRIKDVEYYRVNFVFSCSWVCSIGSGYESLFPRIRMGVDIQLATSGFPNIHRGIFTVDTAIVRSS